MNTSPRPLLLCFGKNKGHERSVLKVGPGDEAAKMVVYNPARCAGVGPVVG